MASLRYSLLLIISVIVGNVGNGASAFSSPRCRLQNRSSTSLQATDDNKFGFGQRVESVKCATIGGLSGSVASAPFAAIHDVLLNGSPLGQWEFDTDAAAVEGALFAIVYRYCIRVDDNPQLNEGAIGAFVLVRTFSRLQIPSYCSAVPLDCGPPFGYLDWNVLSQLFTNGFESAILFGAAAYALDRAIEKGFVSKFPG